jgi:hypothetical protein
MPNALRIRSKTGGKRVCRKDCLLHPLVVRRFAPSSKWMTIRSALFRARSVRNNKLFYSFWITPRRGKVLSASARHRPADVWALAGALTSHSGRYILWFSNIFNGERGPTIIRTETYVKP